MLLVPMLSFGQGLEEALRYSSTDNYSTARSMGVAGAYGAMGADFSSISHNPATLGNYWRSEFSLSMGSNGGSNSASINIPKDNFYGHEFSFENVGFISSKKSVNNKWRTASLGLGLNKIADYYYDMVVSGQSKGSAIESPEIIEQDLLDFSPYKDAIFDKEQVLEENGSNYEMVLGYGGRLNKRFMFGVTLGIPFVNYRGSKKYKETSPEDLRENPAYYCNSIETRQNVSTVGSGINLKLGAIYVLSDNVRLGFAAHTPTRLSIKEDYDIYTSFDYENHDYEISTVDYEGYFDYRITTPWKFIGSAGYIFRSSAVDKLSGFVNFDAEYKNHSQTKFRYDTQEAEYKETERDLNRKIRKELRGALNLRLGGELAYDYLRLRLGGALEDSPFAESGTFSEPKFVFSTGLGYRGNNFYLDFAYLASYSSYSYYPYVSNDEKRSTRIVIDDYKDKFLLTLGVKF